MSKLLIDETFDRPALDAQLEWFNPPPTWGVERGHLIVQPGAKTDYWQKTHYGFVADSGHFLFARVRGDFVMTTQVRFHPANQYDQAGMMVRLSHQCWLKTSAEFEPDEADKLGAVVTNGGYSDWSVQDFHDDQLTVRVRREGSDYMVEYLSAGTPADPHWALMRVAHLHEDDGEMPVQCGLYACSPLGEGYSAEFAYLKIEQGRIA